MDVNTHKMKESNWTYFLIGGTLYQYNERLYWPELWARDVLAQANLWKEVHVVCGYKPTSKLATNFLEIPSHIYFHTFPKRRICHNIVHLLRALQPYLKKDCTIYEYASTSIDSLLAFFFSRLLGEKRTVVTIDGPIEIVPLQSSIKLPSILWKVVLACLKWMRKLAVRQSLAVIAIGKGVLYEIGICDPTPLYEKILIVPLSLYSESEVLTEAEFEELWKEKLGDNAFVVVCADRIAPEKGHLQLAQAARQLVNEFSDIQFVIYGEGPAEMSLRKFIEQNNLASIIQLKGKVSYAELLRAFRKCDVAVNLTRSWDLNRASIDAASQGAAVISSDLPGARSFFSHGEDAHLVNPGDVDAIIQGLRSLKISDRYRKTVAKHGVIKARQYTAESTKALRKEFILRRLSCY